MICDVPEAAQVLHVIIPSNISQSLWNIVNDREAVVQILNRLHDQLGNNSAPYRRLRDLEDPDLFDYVDARYVSGRWLFLRFSVNDVRAEGYLFVEAVSCR